MNAAARAFAQNNLAIGQQRVLQISTQTLGMILLVVAILASAVTVVYIKALNRELFSDLQNLQQNRDQLRVEYGQLLLEQNTWAAPARVQTIAQQQLGMYIPAAKDTLVVHTNYSVAGSLPNG